MGEIKARILVVHEPIHQIHVPMHRKPCNPRYFILLYPRTYIYISFDPPAHARRGVPTANDNPSLCSCTVLGSLCRKRTTASSFNTCAWPSNSSRAR
uniref:Uncharacterized protein n=1 Tax=Mycena chlorophos TaxID=658473 RepID=A0ABQ0LGQ4_MYCCL|nr:predicted protein [Mycena chlorophos]